jgi:hypothetical protein
MSIKMSDIPSQPTHSPLIFYMVKYGISSKYRPRSDKVDDFCSAMQAAFPLMTVPSVCV